MKFIEVTAKGQKVLVNLDHVEEIRESNGECVIYYAFTSPDAIDQDHLTPDESYKQVRDMIMNIAPTRRECGAKRTVRRQKHEKKNRNSQ